MKEKTIEEMFAHYQPDLGDSGEYMAHLTKKLETAEYAKQYKAEQTRRYRHLMVLIFVAGVLFVQRLVDAFEEEDSRVFAVSKACVSVAMGDELPQISLLNRPEFPVPDKFLHGMAGRKALAALRPPPCDGGENGPDAV